MITIDELLQEFNNQLTEEQIERIKLIIIEERKKLLDKK
jgi:hypothetical protein